MATKTEKKKSKSKRYAIELTTMSAVLWSVLLFFLLAWIFVFGIMVGRGSLPDKVTQISDLREKIKKVQMIVGSNETNKQNTSKSDESAPKLDFYKQLESKKEVVKNNLKSTSKENTSKVSPSSTKKKEPPSLLKKETKPEPVAKKGNYTVQLASLGEKARAENLINRLIKNGFDAYYYETLVDGKTYYRVRCGRFTTNEEAKLYSLKLKIKEDINGFVTRIQ